MKKLIILILLIGYTATSQIEVGLYQDAKLAVLGDDRGNDAFTPNLVLTVKLINQGAMNEWAKGVFVYPLVEFASLKGGEYLRYALGFGYKFKINRFSINPSIDYGRIKRWGFVYSSFNGLIELNYSVTPQIGVSALAGLTQRNDLYDRWDDKDLKQNFYLGFTYNIN